MRVVIGTSGWQYRHWRGGFYPDGLPQKDWLAWYADRFPTVEINNTFYMLPKEETFVRWRRGVPDGFVFVVKANRYITHIRRLRDARDAVRRFWVNCRRLGAKLGPVLFQLPPNLQADVATLESFVAVLPAGIRASFEFRHPSWETDEVYGVLDRAGASLVIADRPGARPPDVVTGGWSYVRFHQGRMVGPWYPRSKLARWADRIAGMDAGEVWVFFNNDPEGAAIRDARTLTSLLQDRGVTVDGPAPPKTDAGG